MLDGITNREFISKESNYQKAKRLEESPAVAGPRKHVDQNQQIPIQSWDNENALNYEYVKWLQYIIILFQSIALGLWCFPWI